MDRLEEEELVPGARRCSTSFSARGHDMAQVLLGPAAQGRRRGLRLLPLAAAAARARRAARGCARLGHGPRRRLFGRARYRRRVQLSQSGRRARACRCAAASARNIRRPPAGRRRSTTSATCSDEGPRGRDRGGARRRRQLRDRRILVGADHRDDADNCRCCSTSRTMATAFRCRPTIRRRAATSPANLASFCGPDDLQRRRHRSGGGGAAGRRGGRPCPRASGRRRCCG